MSRAGHPFFISLERLHMRLKEGYVLTYCIFLWNYQPVVDGKMDFRPEMVNIYEKKSKIRSLLVQGLPLNREMNYSPNGHQNLENIRNLTFMHPIHKCFKGIGHNFKWKWGEYEFTFPQIDVTLHAISCFNNSAIWIKLRSNFPSILHGFVRYENALKWRTRRKTIYFNTYKTNCWR